MVSGCHTRVREYDKMVSKSQRIVKCVEKMISECHTRVHEYDKMASKSQRILQCVEKMVSERHIRVRGYDIRSFWGLFCPENKELE